MKIAVDFDGTIVDHRFPRIGNPKPFAFEALKALNEEGHQLILWSNREGQHLKEAVDFCRQNGVEFYAINSDYPNASWTGSGISRKLMADVYVDDKNLGGIPDWPEIYSMLSRKADTAEFADSELGKAFAAHSKKKRKQKKDKKRKEFHHKKSSKFLEFFKTISRRCKDARVNFRF